MAATNLYSPLEPSSNCIRLLRINKEEESESNDIICELVEVGLDDVPEYQAISYRWSQFEPGMTYTSPRLIINGRDSSEFRVGENLYEALKQIRSPNRDAYLWADAICINQEDDRERGHQVKQMGDIYRSADEVLIQLGPSSEDIEYLFSLVSFIDHSANKAQAIGGAKTAWRSWCERFMDKRPAQFRSNERLVRALQDLLKREWWSRVWILQEVAKARRATIMCGSHSCPARTFALVPSLLGLEVSSQAQAVLDIMPRYRSSTWWNSDRDLYSLLQKFKDSNALMPRDKIYALLGMSGDACDPERFYPCYQASDDQVIRNTASFLILGQVLDSTFVFPHFELHHLYNQKFDLVCYVLLYAVRRSPECKLLNYLLNYIKEGELGVWNWLGGLTRMYGPVVEEQVRNILSHGATVSSVAIVNYHPFGAGQPRYMLTITSKKHAEVFVSLDLANSFPLELRYAGTLKFGLGTHIPSPYSPEVQWLGETVQKLIKSGSPVEEIVKETRCLGMLSRNVGGVVMLSYSRSNLDIAYFNQKRTSIYKEPKVFSYKWWTSFLTSGGFLGNPD